MRVLVVDDSIVFRTQISAALNGVSGIEVVGTAPNGKIALQKLEQLSVDLITLDMEMPELNGLETLKIMREKGFKTKVIFFSSLTVKGAEITLQALRAGADDFVTKPTNDVASFEMAGQMIKEALVPKVLQFGNIKIESSITKPVIESPRIINTKKKLASAFPQAIVIASSTGGPSALEEIFKHLKGPFNKPVFIAQHMPAVFTEILAKRLSDICKAPVREGKNGEVVEKGVVYIAPGDFHMLLEKKDNTVVISLNQNPQRNSVRPAADYLFESAADVYGKSLLGIVLTGMGEDGARGAKYLREKDGLVIIQNKESCVVFGMPGAVFNNDDFDEIQDLQTIANSMKSVIM
ncbi:MAG: chemotaxis response regulator protein-glutamate methylesterase [Bacteriovoracaceae bacterium]